MSQKNLPAAPAMDRAAFLDLMKPVKERYDQQQEEQNAALVAFELDVVSQKTQRFGWHGMDERMKQRLTDDWTDVLRVYPIAEVRRGIADCLAEYPRTCPNEDAVKVKITARRSAAAQRLPRQAVVVEEPRRKLTGEERAARKKFAEGVINGFGTGDGNE